MTPEKYFVGIDLDENRAMVSLFYAGMKEPETFSAVPGEERYQIPTAIFITGQENFYYGDEALKRQERPDGTFFSDLYREALNQDNVICRNLLVRFLKRLLRFRERCDLQKKELCLALTVPEITAKVVSLAEFLRTELEIAQGDFRLMDYGESFFAHTYHQEASIWLHDVALFDYHGETITFRLLHTNGAGSVKQVVSEKKEWTVPEYLKGHPAGRDEFFANILRESFLKKIVSGVYFIGDGFDGDWLHESLRVIGSNKRVFKGNNLYTCGACYAAYRNEYTDGWRFYYDCPYKLQGEASVRLLKDGKPCNVLLNRLGENWFAPTETFYLMYRGDPTLTVTVRTRERMNARTETITLDYLPERENHSIRLRLNARPESGDKMMLTVADDGFGELYESSGRVWEFPVPLS